MGKDTRMRRWREIADNHGTPDTENFDFMDPQWPFVAVQTNQHSDTWYTGGETIKRAVHFCQEADQEVGGWSPPIVYDMETGETWHTELRYVITRVENVTSETRRG